METKPTRRRWTRWLVRGILITVVILLTATIFLVNLIWFRPFSVHHFFERSFVMTVIEDPEELSRLRVLDGFGITAHQRRLTDPADVNAFRLYSQAKRDLETLSAYPAQRLSAAQRLSTDVLSYYLNDRVEGAEFIYHTMPVNYVSDVQRDVLEFMATIHEIHDRTDAGNYLARLEHIAPVAESLLKMIETRREMKLEPPRPVVARTVADLRRMVDAPVESGALYLDFERKLANASAIAPADRAEFLSRAKRLLGETVYPYYRDLMGALEGSIDAVSEDTGAWRLPKGDRFYGWTLRHYTTLPISPEDAESLALSEVRRIRAQLRGKLAEIGADGEELGTILSELAAQPRFRRETEHGPRDQWTVMLQEIIAAYRPRLALLFDVRPSSGVFVKTLPPPLESDAPTAAYVPPSFDHVRQGAVYANLDDLALLPTYADKALVFREAIPGRHYQAGIQQELGGVPTFRRAYHFAAFDEGWALYAQQLAAEHGYYEDPHEDIGRLQYELFQAALLVADVGMHFRRWSRDDALDYLKTTAGMPTPIVERETDRLIVEPGRAAAGPFGRRAIVTLRHQARTALGPRFNLKEFHTAVLSNGSVPLPALNGAIEFFIHAQKGSESKGKGNTKG